MNMKQVMIRNESTNGIGYSWIDETHAFVGSRVSFKGDSTVMRVEEVYGKTFPSAYINERSRDFKNTRKASDI